MDYLPGKWKGVLSDVVMSVGVDSLFLFERRNCIVITRDSIWNRPGHIKALYNCHLTNRFVGDNKNAEKNCGEYRSIINVFCS